MLCNRDVLFVHVPKAAGMSMTNYLLERLEPPILYTSADPDEHLPPGVVHVTGQRHERLVEATKLAADHGFPGAEVPLMLAVIRNPYELELSRYAYLQAGNRHDAGPAQTLALEHDFETFACESPYYGRSNPALEEFFLLDGRMLPQMRVVRLEHLAGDVREALAPIGLGQDELPWLNRSRHDDWRLYYTPRAEEAVYERYRWIFDQGWYDRLDCSADHDAWPHQTGHRLPMNGPVKQVGPSRGHSEGWVLPRLEFGVRPTNDVSKIVITGWRPPEWGNEIPLAMTVDGGMLRRERVYGPWFQWEIDVCLPRNRRVLLAVDSPAGVKPSSRGSSADERELVFQLQQVTFISAGEGMGVVSE